MIHPVLRAQFHCLGHVLVLSGRLGAWGEVLIDHSLVMDFQDI